MRAITYGSICSGIEAASVAWEPLGWKPVWFAEIEPFPCAVLNSRWPQVPNLGDMTAIAELADIGVIAPEIIVGGTPCQAFSVAGLRNGLADARGQLTLSYVELADAIDDKRRERGEEEAIFVWENVPGVLSSKDNAFGCFIGALAGEECELQPSGGKWTNAGCVYGPSRVVAWRILDAQFFRVAQRRRRVFVVASAREGFDPAKILFELDSMRRNSPPSRTPQAPASANAGKSPDLGSHWDNPDNPDNPHPTLNQSSNIGGIGQSNQEIFSQRGSGLVSETQYGKELAGTLTARHDSSPCADRGMNVVGTYRMTAFGEYADDETASTVKARDYKDATDLAVIAFNSKDSGQDATSDLSPTLRACNSTNSNQNAGGPPAVAYCFKGGQGAKAGGIGYAKELSPTLTSASSGSNLSPTVMQNTLVRRLTPVECERLQGFPDNHTLIGWRGKNAAECPDGPRYKAIGNSMAVPVMRWIGQRIAEALK